MIPCHRCLAEPKIPPGRRSVRATSSLCNAMLMLDVAPFPVPSLSPRRPVQPNVGCSSLVNTLKLFQILRRESEDDPELHGRDGRVGAYVVAPAPRDQLATAVAAERHRQHHPGAPGPIFPGENILRRRPRGVPNLGGYPANPAQCYLQHPKAVAAVRKPTGRLVC